MSILTRNISALRRLKLTREDLSGYPVKWQIELAQKPEDLKMSPNELVTELDHHMELIKQMNTLHLTTDDLIWGLAHLPSEGVKQARQIRLITRYANQKSISSRGQIKGQLELKKHLFTLVHSDDLSRSILPRAETVRRSISEIDRALDFAYRVNRIEQQITYSDSQNRAPRSPDIYHRSGSNSG